MTQVRTAVKIASATLVWGVLIAGCSGDDADDEPTTVQSGGTAQSPTQEPTTEAPVEPTTPPPVDGVVDLSDPAAGIVFTNLPDATGPEAAAVNAYLAFEVAYWESLKANVVSDALPGLATANALDVVSERVAFQTTQGFTFGGTARSSVRVDIIQEDYAVISACGSDVDVTAIYSDGTVRAFDGEAAPTFRRNAELAELEGTWFVQEYWIDEEACSVEDAA